MSEMKYLVQTFKETSWKQENFGEVIKTRCSIYKIRKFERGYSNHSFVDSRFTLTWPFDNFNPDDLNKNPNRYRIRTSMGDFHFFEKERGKYFEVFEDIIDAIDYVNSSVNPILCRSQFKDIKQMYEVLYRKRPEAFL